MVIETVSQRRFAGFAKSPTFKTVTAAMENGHVQALQEERTNALTVCLQLCLYVYVTKPAVSLSVWLGFVSGRVVLQQLPEMAPAPNLVCSRYKPAC